MLSGVKDDRDDELAKNLGVKAMAAKVSAEAATSKYQRGTDSYDKQLAIYVR